jgi:ectoine hydroxylase-related dioxygenase (phytanoyl-CoA dioxygenase family)
MSAAFATIDRQEAHGHWSGELLDHGYCIIPDLMPPAKVAALHDDLKSRFAHTPFCEGDFYGGHTKRFGSLLKRSRHAAAFVQNKLILDITQDILGPWCDRFQLNLTQALEIWPGEGEQVPHRDQDMWRAPPGETEYLLNVMWPFTPYREENGATVVWPDSHRRQADYELDRADAISAEMEPGSALLFLGSTLHGGGANRTRAPRAGMIVSYCLGWLKPFENQWLVYPPGVARGFTPELAALVGYQQHRPNLGNYEGRCPSVLLRDGLPDYLNAVDELRDDQIEPLAEFKARQRGGGADSSS